MLPLPKTTWEAPDRVTDAIALASEPGARWIAGGTDLVPSMKHRIFAPTTLVSTRRMVALRGIEPRGEWL
jgi:4-hydroxybenzoyl-CoA reductase subunit beta